MRLRVFNSYTYTLETIIQAGQAGLTVKYVPIQVNPDLRPSRLVKSTWSYLVRSLITILRIFAVYRPVRVFAALGILSVGIGVLIGIRFMVLFLMGGGVGNVQSLILTAILILLGSQLFMFALLADLISINRQLLETLDYRILANLSNSDLREKKAKKENE